MERLPLFIWMYLTMTSIGSGVYLSVFCINREEICKNPMMRISDFIRVHNQVANIKNDNEKGMKTEFLRMTRVRKAV